MKKTVALITLLVILVSCAVLPVSRSDELRGLSLPYGLYNKNSYIDGSSWGTRLYSDDGIEGEFVCCGKEKYKRLLRSNYKNIQLNVDGVPDCSAEWETLPEDQNSKDAEVLQYSFQVGAYKTKPKLIRYKIDKENGTLYILEEYAIKEDHGIIMGDSGSVPARISFWGEEKDTCFYGYLEGFKQRPTTQWLSAIGVKNIGGP